MSASDRTTDCDCQPSEFPFECPRHQCEKTEHWHFLCRTNRNYFKMWERGIGPGQTPDPDAPGLLQMGWNLAKSLASFVADGLETVSSEEYERRLQICDHCDQRHQNSCKACGCTLSLKAAGRAFDCPLHRWDP